MRVQVRVPQNKLVTMPEGMLAASALTTLMQRKPGAKPVILP